jgi:hypothetical protein
MGYKIMLDYADKVYLSTGPDGTTLALEFETVVEDDSQLSSTDPLHEDASGCAQKDNPLLFDEYLTKAFRDCDC